MHWFGRTYALIFKWLWNSFRSPTISRATIFKINCVHSRSFVVLLKKPWTSLASCVNCFFLGLIVEIENLGCKIR